MNARTPEYLALQSDYREVMRRIAKLNAQLGKAQGHELEIIILKLHAAVAEMNEILDRAEVEVQITP